MASIVHVQMNNINCITVVSQRLDIATVTTYVNIVLFSSSLINRITGKGRDSDDRKSVYTVLETPQWMLRHLSQTSTNRDQYLQLRLHHNVHTICTNCLIISIFGSDQFYDNVVKSRRFLLDSRRNFVAYNIFLSLKYFIF